MTQPTFEIPPDRAGKSRFLHRLFIFTGLLSRISPVELLPISAAVVAISCWPWHAHRVTAAILSALFLLVNGGMLALLPIAGRSWGPVAPPLLGLTAIQLLLSWLLAWLMPGQSGLVLWSILNGALTVVAGYATWLEPFRLQVTQRSINLGLTAQTGERPLRLLHISDLHFEGFSPREAALLEAVETLAPDLIVLTGDYLNLSSVHDPASQAATRELLAQLKAPLGTYAIIGSPAVDVPEIIPRIFAGLPIHWLSNQTTAIKWQGRTLWLIGVECTLSWEKDRQLFQKLRQTVPPKSPTILLYHTPDLMPDVAAQGIDLYLAGHTHGGQLRLPLYGALFTSSRWGKRYEMGPYREAATTLYVSRGLGMEGLGAPRARFLAPPEIILWELG
ncbi:MAG: metallophosphoesterase [Anaerolineae bacterium]|nr:metallophosphoesterase [Anaerolineae bacterium]